MNLRRFIPFPGGGDLLDKMQDLLRIVLDDLQENRVTNANLVEAIPLDAGVDVPIYHGLGAPMRTWDVVRQNADARVWEGSPSISPKHFFNLTASGPVVVTIRCT